MATLHTIRAGLRNRAIRLMHADHIQRMELKRGKRPQKMAQNSIHMAHENFLTVQNSLKNAQRPALAKEKREKWLESGT
jgi:hypothetical protein